MTFTRCVLRRPCSSHPLVRRHHFYSGSKEKRTRFERRRSKNCSAHFQHSHAAFRLLIIMSKNIFSSVRTYIIASE